MARMLERGERRLLQLGGLSGLSAVGAIAVALIIRLGLPATGLATVEEYLRSSPALQANVITAYRLGYFASFLYIPFVVALHRSLGKTRPINTLVATVLSFAAATLFVVYFLGLVNTSFALSQRYASVEPGNQITVIIAGEAALGVLHGIQVAGFFFLGLGFISFGLSMLANASFNKILGWLGMVFGGVIIALPFSPVSSLFAFPLWAIFSLLVSVKVYSLSKGK